MKVFSVSEYIQFLNESLVAIVPYNDLAVEGEVANFKISQDKWVWFDLKDEAGLINCFMTTWDLKVPLEDGMKIRALGFPKIYQKSGKFSITIKQIELVGEGALKKAYEMLKKKLEAEGLFATERKRALPRFPKKIALITSPTAAAYTDFIRIINNRWGGVEVDLLPVVVQGKEAVGEVTRAFYWLNNHAGDYDVCVLTRGGGSLEDLQAFNSEETARAVYSSKVPVVCAIGHERDVSLAELSADVRASTPSNAAERVVPSREEVLGELDFMQGEIADGLSFRLTELGHTIERQFNFIEQAARGPLEKTRQLFSTLEQHFNDLVFQLEKKQAVVDSYERLFANLNPRQLLKRGYSITRDSLGRVIRSAQQVGAGDKIVIELSEGNIKSKVI